MNRIFIVAGEPSGDIHAASLVAEIKKLRPETEFYGTGGIRMREEGVKLIYDYKEISFIGFTAVITNLSKIRKAFSKCESEIKQFNPDAIILVDFPGFNLRLLKNIRKFYKGKIIYYISPQLWAWHESRVETIRKYADKMLVVFPFEVEFYKKHGIEAEFVGHPLVKKTDAFLTNFKKQYSDAPLISILPGSRKGEILRMMPVMRDTALRVQKEFNAQINLMCSANFSPEFYKEQTAELEVNLVYEDETKENYYSAIANSDFVIVKSGTSTLECGLLGIPFCTVYSIGKLNYLLAKSLIKIKYISIVNILLDREAVKEYIQSEMNSVNLFNEVKKAIVDKTYSETITNQLKELRTILTNKDASYNAAVSIIETAGI